MHIRQNYRIYPNLEQQNILIQWLGQSRFIWNFMLDKNIETYQNTNKFVFAYDMNNMLPNIKNQPEYVWLKEIPSQCLQQKCQDLDTALKQSFKSSKNKKGFPKFKSKKTDESGIRFPSFKFNGNRIVLPKMKQGIKIKLHTPIQGQKGAITIIKDKCGHFYASILVKIDETPLVSTIKSSVGIDLGLKEFAVTSDGEIIKNPRFGKKQEKKIAKIQRKYFRQQKDSNSREKTRVKLAKQYKHVTNQRKDFVHKIAVSITKNNDLVAIESLNVKGMMKNSHLSKAIADVSWGSFTTTLAWHCKKRGKHLVEINRWYPSSKTCSCCGEQKKDLTLKDRTYQCESCGFELDRDINAAINIHKEGLRMISNTVGITEIYADEYMNFDVRNSVSEAIGSLDQ